MQIKVKFFLQKKIKNLSPANNIRCNWYYFPLDASVVCYIASFFRPKRLEDFFLVILN